MSKVLVNESSLTNIANAIREKNGETTKYKPAEMGTAISNIVMNTGDLPLSVLTNTKPYKFSYDGWNDVIAEYGELIDEVYGCEYLFYLSDSLEEIPFKIVIGDIQADAIANSMFYNCYQLKTIKGIRIYSDDFTGMNGHNLNIRSLFMNCRMLKEVPNDLFLLGTSITTYDSYSGDSIFNGCCSLRKIPDINDLYSIGSSLLSSLCYGCYSLDELKNLPCPNQATTSSKFLNQTAVNCFRLKEFTFKIRDTGYPQVQSWKNQTLDLSQYVGYVDNVSGLNSNYMTYFNNAGITSSDEVKDAISYEANKNNPNYWTTNIAYSRYNHDSAVNTINSLPNVSVNGSNNIIKFKSASGALTDGGAISKLTEEEIAVATARGWTLSLV